MRYRHLSKGRLAPTIVQLVNEATGKMALRLETRVEMAQQPPDDVSRKGFTEPVTLSSIVPADFPPSALRLPRTASGDDFNLLASRARCVSEPMGSRPPGSRARRDRNVHRARFFFSGPGAEGRGVQGTPGGVQANQRDAGRQERYKKVV